MACATMRCASENEKYSTNIRQTTKRCFKIKKPGRTLGHNDDPGPGDPD